MTNIGTNISKLRMNENLSQEKFAQKLDVTRQAVQKWESGSARPDLDNIMKIAKLFNVSMDTIAWGADKRTTEILHECKILPEYENIHNWDLYSSDLLIEYRQSVEEGKDISQYEDLFKAVAKMPKGEQKENIADVLFDIVHVST